METLQVLSTSRPSLRRRSALSSVAVVGTYLPRKCGIATFTSDLVRALTSVLPGGSVRAVAMNDVPHGYCYPPEVAVEIDQHDPVNYSLAAESLNQRSIDVVSIQHEFGIFGGVKGSYVTHLMSGLHMPVVTTLHTILRNPSPPQRAVTRDLCALSERLVVMTETGKEFLHDIYDIPTARIEVIPHGVPDTPFLDPGVFKSKLGFAGRKVVLTFGLLSPNKGIEVMLRAMPHVVREHPDVLYVVLGATHPHVRTSDGRPYGYQLRDLASQLRLDDNVVFYDRFVELAELCEFLGAADINVTPYLNEDQIASGTLSYALSTGKATISTPYWYAKEMLADRRGRLVPFGDSEALAEEICDLLCDDAERQTLALRSYAFSRSAVWREVGRRYLEVFQEAREEWSAVSLAMGATHVA